MSRLVTCPNCGNVADYDLVPPNPGKVCVNAACRTPFDLTAVEGMSFEASNPSDPRDAQRLKLRAQAEADVAAVQAQLK